MTTRLYNLNRHIKTVHKVNDEDYLSKSTPRQSKKDTPSSFKTSLLIQALLGVVILMEVD